MLGLLLVVTMIANYLSTQLPGQMQTNDAAHAITVEDQIARLATALQGAAGVGAVGAVLSQPVSLGSVGEPPVAPGDGASIGPGPSGTQFSLSYAVVGPVTYQGPGNWPAGGNLAKSGCSSSPAGSQSPTYVNCTGSATLTQNFTNGSHYISVTGGSNLHVNFTASYSTVVVGAAGGAGNTVIVVGSHDTVYLNATGGSTVRLTLVGNWDSASISGQGGATVSMLLVGNHDGVSWSANGASSSFVESAWGSHDSTTTSNTNAAVYYTAFDAVNASSSVCPYANDSSTDTVSGSGGTVSYNNTGYSGSGSQGGWTESWHKVGNVACPFYSSISIPQKSSGTVGASFVVALKNTYAPPVEIAYDEGAVILAQRQGLPLMIVKPGITFVGGNLSLWVPEFLGNVGTEVGTGTAELSVMLVSLLNVNLPSGGLNLSGTTSVAVTTPFAAAWYSYLNTTSSLTGDVKCVPKTSTACVGPFTMNGPLGTVYVNVTATVLSLQLATFSVTLG